jgi:competence protein ComEA
MVLTRLEKTTFIALSALLAVGLLLFTWQWRATVTRNLEVLGAIRRVTESTDRDPLVKNEETVVDERETRNKLNINSATLAQLDALPGMGKVAAERILELRKQKGEFKDLTELLAVKGMSRKKLATLARLLTTKGGMTGEAAGLKVNLNFATVKDLQSLPGMGKKLAEAIIEFRNRQGGLHSLEDLLDVDGMTDEKFGKFSDLVEVK